MKIEIKLKSETIFAINKLLQAVYDTPQPIDLNQRIYRSISFDLADKFDKLHKSNVKKSNLFDNNKTYKVSLKIYEAWALEKIIINMLPTVNNDLHKNILQSTASIINQKLT